MRTKEELKELFAKFDRDVKQLSRFTRVMLAFDQFFNALFWNGSQDETISSHIGRRKADGTETRWDNFVCKCLNKLEYNHCKNSLGE